MRWKPVLGIAAVVTAGATVGALFVTDGDAASTTNVNYGNNCPAEGNDIQVDCDYIAPDPDEVQEEQIQQRVQDFADVPPQGDGPWPFVVLDSDIGLKVRSTNEVDAVQLGGLQERHTAWVDCQQTSSFDADPTTGAGPLWYRVRWAHQEPSVEYHESDPGAVHTAWAYAGYLVPWGHNGDIPEC